MGRLGTKPMIRICCPPSLGGGKRYRGELYVGFSSKPWRTKGWMSRPNWHPRSCNQWVVIGCPLWRHNLCEPPGEPVLRPVEGDPHAVVVWGLGGESPGDPIIAVNEPFSSTLERHSHCPSAGGISLNFRKCSRTEALLKGLMR